MTLDLALPWASALSTALVRASFEGGAMAAVAWVVLRLRPAWPASVRCTLWWLVCARFLVSLAWPAPILIPLVPETWPSRAWLPAAATPAVPATAPHATTSSTSPDASPHRDTRGPRESTASPTRMAALGDAARWWPVPVVLLWFAGVSASVWSLARLLQREQRLLAHAIPASPVTQRHLFELVHRLALARAPQVLASSDITSPCVVAGRRPRILLPRAFDDAPAPTVRLALCHELVHLKRHDLAWALVPALAERLLFFHPLARFAAREYALAREAACDAAVLDVLRAPVADYARLILACALPGRQASLGMGGVSAPAAMLKRRLIMLHDTLHQTCRRPSPWTVSLLGVLALAPFQVGAVRPAREATPAITTSAAMQATPAAPEAPAVPAAPPAPPASAARAGATTQPPPPPPPPPAPPAPPAPPPPPPDQGSYVAEAFARAADAWVLLRGDHDEGIHYGSRSDRRKASSHRRGADPLFWFRRGDREFVIRDRTTLEAIERLFEPQRELGQRMGELGTRQGELGAAQGQLGAKQGEMGAMQAALAAKQMAMSAQEMRNPARDAAEAALRAERAKMDQQLRELGASQRELGREQAALGERQRELARQQEVLARTMRELTATAADGLQSLLDQSMASGRAERVK